ncbi:hypothetical protein MRB53_001840 [Persea americana]|uniref:Uncharacterized protein n=1 Tax=Persea americana TaxID=3435 RepID=A0ACC2MSS8_PERAE|nr:hypothetical protein MRB53_001840 [Persea americana]
MSSAVDFLGVWGDEGFLGIHGIVSLKPEELEKWVLLFCWYLRWVLMLEIKESVDDEESESVDVEMGSYVGDEFCVGDQRVCGRREIGGSTELEKWVF